ncbi:hypothetical protein [Candidatus Finniella inopinata]|uniref:Uncharacterized protein n=1 Tax=Candidatus Finniella inopinata TaxID=1696036 RepID=A0A4Q7DLF4_9PROT|nr:hypothetical protein [Candidatus Finniella inopinata]RZI47085.1 hypothetical protein EQU50_00420 [Candidatus Finniella inopinata]
MQIRAPKINRRWPYSMAVLLLTLSAGLSAVVATSSDDDTVLYDPDITQSKCVTTVQEELTQTKASSPGDKKEKNVNSSSFKNYFRSKYRFKRFTTRFSSPTTNPMAYTSFSFISSHLSVKRSCCI